MLQEHEKQSEPGSELSLDFFHSVLHCPLSDRWTRERERSAGDVAVRICAILVAGGEAATQKSGECAVLQMLLFRGHGLFLGLAAVAVAVMAARLMSLWSPSAGFRLFVPGELARYRGGPGDPGLYLALLGRIYDVSSGRRHYEPGAHYSGFAGISGSRPYLL